MTEEQRARIRGHHILFYDGVCGLCDRAVSFYARRDDAQRLIYVSLQSSLGRELIARYQPPAELLKAAAFLRNALDTTEGIFYSSDAVAHTLEQIRQPWPVLGHVILLIPRLIREPIYYFVARIRYRLFGRYSSCLIPSADIRHQFLGYDDF